MENWEREVTLKLDILEALSLKYAANLHIGRLEDEGEEGAAGFYKSLVAKLDAQINEQEQGHEVE